MLRRCRTNGRKAAARPLQPPRPSAAPPELDAAAWRDHWAGIEAAIPASLQRSFEECWDRQRSAAPGALPGPEEC
eukprot:1154900-Lingulodinium_polyedra.AAC.1